MQISDGFPIELYQILSKEIKLILNKFLKTGKEE